MASSAELDVSAAQLVRQAVKWYLKGILEQRNLQHVYEYNYLQKLNQKYSEIYPDE